MTQKRCTNEIENVQSVFGFAQQSEAEEREERGWSHLVMLKDFTASVVFLVKRRFTSKMLSILR